MIIILGFIGGGSAIIFSAILLAAFLVLSDKSFFNVAKINLIANIPVVVSESLISAFVVGFLLRVKPKLIQ